MVMVEATAVVPEGRISPGDVGIWSDAHLPSHARLAAALTALGTVPVIQLAHAGRKASRKQAWLPGAAEPSWETLGPSAEAFGDFIPPRAMTEADIAATIAAFVAATKRSIQAGYRLIELHAAHGYLLHQFLSPLSNKRNDRWGGDFEGRSRLPLEIAAAMRAAMPNDAVLGVRVSHTDWVDGGWTTEETVELPRQQIPLGPGYQVPGAAAVKKGAGIVTAAVGLITEAKQAQAILTEGHADWIYLARVLLRDPYWPLHAAAELGRTESLPTPPQLDRGWNALGKTKMEMSIGAPMPRLG